MGYVNLSPRLVTMEGDIDPFDIALVNKGYLTEAELQYLMNKYPELMGGFMDIVKSVGKGLQQIVSVPIQGVKSLVKTVTGSDSDDSAAQMQIAMMQQQQSQQDQLNKILMYGIPALLILMFLLKKR